ncbi:MAG: LEPR-XLL domain-containing protein [Verrucomicrobiota bacterium]
MNSSQPSNNHRFEGNSRLFEALEPRVLYSASPIDLDVDPGDLSDAVDIAPLILTADSFDMGELQSVSPEEESVRQMHLSTHAEDSQALPLAFAFLGGS